MRLEDYFNFLTPDDIRLQGTRIGIETILYDYLHRGRSPETIAQDYRSLDLEKVFATLTYYFHNKEEVDAYLVRWLEHGHKMWKEQQRNPSPARLRIQKIKQQLKEQGISMAEFLNKSHEIPAR